jgi:hypothetical protein
MYIALAYIIVKINKLEKDIIQHEADIVNLCHDTQNNAEWIQDLRPKY